MTLTPRASEVKAIEELLESEDFDSSSELAKAILKLAAELLQDRESFVVGVHLWDSDWAVYGPYWSQPELNAALKLVQSENVVKVQNIIPATHAAPREHVPEHVDGCGRCNHPEEAHKDKGTRHPSGQYRPEGTCTVVTKDGNRKWRCECPAYVKPKTPAWA